MIGVSTMSELLEQEIFEEDTLANKFLNFRVDSSTYGIELRNVTEIIGIQPITPVPDVPDYIRGVINLRGSITPVMDVRLRFKKGFKEYNDRTCVIVINIHGKSLGMIVDSVSEVITIPETEIVPPPEMGKEDKFIKGVGKVGNEVVLLLDCEKILNIEI